MEVNCNRIMIDGDRVCVVKDTCDGCKMDSRYCALNDLFVDTGLVAGWEKWDMPNFRERVKDEL